MAQLIMFPASAGMNRHSSIHRVHSDNVPRVRGDEPPDRFEYTFITGMFPASAGMNRYGERSLRQRLNVPRVRGDEPDALLFAIESFLCSPRPRG